MKKIRKYLYVRVSTKEQNESRQLSLKEKYGLNIENIVEQVKSVIN